MRAHSSEKHAGQSMPEWPSMAAGCTRAAAHARSGMQTHAPDDHVLACHAVSLSQRQPEAATGAATGRAATAAAAAAAACAGRQLSSSGNTVTVAGMSVVFLRFRIGRHDDAAAAAVLLSALLQRLVFAARLYMSRQKTLPPASFLSSQPECKLWPGDARCPYSGRPANGKCLCQCWERHL